MHYCWKKSNSFNTILDLDWTYPPESEESKEGNKFYHENYSKHTGHGDQTVTNSSFIYIVDKRDISSSLVLLDRRSKTCFKFT